MTTKEEIEKLIGYQVPDADEIFDTAYSQALEAEELMTPKPEPEPKETCLAKVTIRLNDAAACNIQLEVSDDARTEADAKTVAGLVYSLNEGHMKVLFADIINRPQDSPTDTQFAQLIMKKWQEYYQQNDDTHLKPSQALKGHEG